MTVARYRRQLWLQSHVYVIPTLYAIVALLLGTFVPALDQAVPIDIGISESAATTYLAATGQGMIAFTALSFSFTLLILQFGTASLSPRLVAELRRDALGAHALGTFTATFIYSLGAVLDVGVTAGDAVVPTLTVAVSVALLIASVFMFLALTQRSTYRLQIPVMLHRVARFGREAIVDTYDPLDRERSPREEPPALPADAPTAVVPHAGPPRVLAAMDLVRLRQLAHRNVTRIEVLCAIGEQLGTGRPVFRLTGAPIPDRALSAALVLAPARTIKQDPGWSIRLIVDVAVKALSPAINDPTTAVQAIDALETVLRELAGRRLAAELHDDQDWVVVRSPDWEDYVGLALDEIALYGRESIQVLRRLRALIEDLLEVCPEDRRPVLSVKLAQLDDAAKRLPARELVADATAADRLGLGMARAG